MRPIWVWLIPLVGLLLAITSGADLRTLVSAQAVSITNTGTTPIRAQLQGATSVQVYIRASSTAQNFTLTLADTTTIEVPSGGAYTLRSAVPFNASDVVFQAQTATSAAVLQVISTREIKE